MAAGIGEREPYLRSRFSRFAAFVMASLLPGAYSAAQTLPAPFEAEYAGRKFPLTAETTIRLARAGDYYRYTMRGAVYMAFYKLTETYDCSVAQVRDGEIYPLEYVHRDRRGDLRTHFDWRERTARTTRGDGSVVEITDLPRVAWDVMSFHLRLRADAQAAQGNGRDYAVVEKGVLTRHRAKYAGTETIEIDGDAVKAAGVVAESPKRVHEFWFAPNYAWLPVRIAVGEVTLELASSPKAAARPVEPAGAAAPRCE